VKKTSPIMPVVLFSLIVFPALFSNQASALEEAEYSVLKQAGEYELRQYKPNIVAETWVEGDFEQAGNEGFRRLFAYIDGQNRKKQSIPMTAPVSLEAEGEKIPMTAPVNLEKTGGKYRITFQMPSRYTLDTLPEPLDSRVNLKEVPGRLMAAIRYSGTWKKSLYEEKQSALLEWIRQNGLQPVGEPIFARYNSPFSLWFLRRNEVLIPVIPAGR
jgi:effector-binding domain-containing protein